MNHRRERALQRIRETGTELEWFAKFVFVTGGVAIPRVDWNAQHYLEVAFQHLPTENRVKYLDRRTLSDCLQRYGLLEVPPIPVSSLEEKVFQSHYHNLLIHTFKDYFAQKKIPYEKQPKLSFQELQEYGVIPVPLYK